MNNFAFTDWVVFIFFEMSYQISVIFDFLICCISFIFALAVLVQTMLVDLIKLTLMDALARF